MVKRQRRLVDNSNLLIILFVFVVLNEAIIEYLFSSVDELKNYLGLLSLGFAVLLTFSYQLNLITIALGVHASLPLVDYLLSGFVIARLSNFVNDLASRFLKSK